MTTSGTVTRFARVDEHGVIHASTSTTEGLPVFAVDPDIDHPCVDEEGDGKCDECGKACDVHPTAPDEDEKPFPPEASATEVAFAGIAAVLDYETEDGRLISPDGFTWRTLPLPLMYQDTNPAMGGHEGAFLIGRIEEVQVIERRVYVRGVFDLNAADRAADIVECVRAQTARFVSVDLSAADADIEVRSVDEEGWPVDVLARFSNAVMAGATVTPFPAIPDAVIWLDGELEPAETAAELPDPPEPVTEPEVVEGEPMMILASARPPRPEAWFLRSALHDGTAAQIIEDNRGPHVRLDGDRVYGYVARFGVCHIGLPGCTVAPSSRSDYAYFLTGTTPVECDCDEGHIEMPCGVLTRNAFHATGAKSASQTLAHYEHTGTAWADVNIGEDDFGIWIAGAVRPGVSDEERAVLDGSNLSGDWRSIGGSLELVATLSVNVPGFPMVAPAAYVAASGYGELEVAALIGAYDPALPSLAAAGHRSAQHVLVDREQWSALHARLATVEAYCTALRAQAADALAASL